MDIHQIRREVEKAYSGDRWVRKVAAMSDRQVIAVFYRLKKEGVIK